MHKRMSQDLLEVMRLIYRRDNKGAKTSYTGIGIDLEISKPTTRKRIRHLVKVGYIKESKKGRTKFVDLTEMGRSLLSK